MLRRLIPALLLLLAWASGAPAQIMLGGAGAGPGSYSIGGGGGAGTPTVTAIAPPSGTSGTSVSVTGTNLTNASAVKFGATNATSFTVNSATAISAIAPTGSGTVDITVTTPGGTSATSSADQFSYAAAPTVTALSPNNGTAAGGTSVTVTGTNLTGATAVAFGGTAATSFSVTNATTIAATAPAGTIGAIVDVTVTTAAGTSATGAGDKFTYASCAAAAALFGRMDGTQANVSLDTAVCGMVSDGSWSGVSALWVLTASSSANALLNWTSSSFTLTKHGTCTFTANTNYACDGSTGYFDTGFAANNVAQNSGAFGLCIYNAAVDTNAGGQISATSVATYIATVSSTAITAEVNTGTFGTSTVASTQGAWVVNRTSSSNQDLYQNGSYSLSQTKTSSAPGSQTLYISQNNNGGAPQSGSYTSGSIGYVFVANAQLTSAQISSIASRMGVYIAAIGGPSGCAPSGVPAAPTVTAVAPTSGPTAGGTAVTITGTGFTGASAVAFGGTAATSFSVSNATTIAATAPAGSGTVDITVTTAGGTSAPSSADQFSYVAAPTVTALSPTSGAAAGGTSVTVTGTNFTGASAVKFGSANATSFSVTNATTIAATSPSGSGTVDVTVTTAGGTSATSSADQFAYTGGASCSASSALETRMDGSQNNAALDAAICGMVTDGSWSGLSALWVLTASSEGNARLNWTSSSYTLVKNGSCTFNANTSYACDGSTGYFDPSFAQNNTGQNSAALGGCDYAASPVVGTLFGVVQGSSLEFLMGGATSIRFDLNDSRFVNDTVTTSQGSWVGNRTSSTNVDVYHNGSYSYSFSATSAAPSTTHALVAARNNAGTIDRFMSDPLGYVFVANAQLSAGQISSITSRMATYISTIGGPSSCAPSGTPPPAPTVTAIAPTGGTGAGGTSVSITGTNFTGATAVKFGTANATAYTVNSATAITATSPAGSGTVDVTVSNSGGTSSTSSADQFTYAAPLPTVTALSPTTGPAGGGTAVTVTGSNFTGATSVKFGATAAAFSVTNATTIAATSPAGSGTVDVTVTTAAGTSAASTADQFTYGTVVVATDTFDPANHGTHIVLSNGNLTATLPGSSGSDNEGARTVHGFSTGKYYWEITVTGATNETSFGLATANMNLTGGNMEEQGDLVNGEACLNSATSCAIGAIQAGRSSGYCVGSGTFPPGCSGTITPNLFIANVAQGAVPGTNVGDVMGLAVDLSAKKIWVRNVTANANLWNSSNTTADVGNGIGGISFGAIANPGSGYFPAITHYCCGSSGSSNKVAVANFGATSYAGTMPTGFSNWGGGTTAPALTISGPSSGTVSVPSSSFTVSLSGATFNGSQTVTVSDGGNGGTITPSVGSSGVSTKTVTPLIGASGFTFTYTPVIVCNLTLTITNAQSWTNPAPLTYTSNPCSSSASLSITAPASISVSNGVTTTLSGISISDAAVGSTGLVTVTVADTLAQLSCPACTTLPAGTGTKQISTGTLTQVNSDLATLTIKATANDTIAITASDNVAPPQGGNQASPVYTTVTVH